MMIYRDTTHQKDSIANNVMFNISIPMPSPGNSTTPDGLSRSCKIESRTLKGEFTKFAENRLDERNKTAKCRSYANYQTMASVEDMASRHYVAV